jgi:hypothetical protein
MEITAGFWWARIKHNRLLIVVEITLWAEGFRVMFMGNPSWPKLHDTQHEIELIAKIEPPLTAGKREMPHE